MIEASGEPPLKEPSFRNQTEEPAGRSRCRRASLTGDWRPSQRKCIPKSRQSTGSLSKSDSHPLSRPRDASADQTRDSKRITQPWRSRCEKDDGREVADRMAVTSGGEEDDDGFRIRAVLSYVHRDQGIKFARRAATPTSRSEREQKTKAPSFA